MKKQFFALLFLGGFTLFLSCSKDEQTSPATIDTSKTAVIKGVVKAQLDLLNDTTETTLEYVPSGTKIIFKVPASQYVLSATGTYNDLLFETTVGANGGYSFNMPVTNKGVNFKIVPVSFEFNQGQRVFEDGQWVSGTPIRKIYTCEPVTVVGVITGETRIQDLTYAAN